MPTPRPVDLQAAFTDHDRLFKELITVFFVDFLDLFLPEIAADIDRDSITFLDKELFSDLATGEKHEVDIVVRARFRATDAFFLIHVENQANAQSDFAERLFCYFADLFKKYRLPVYPVALFSFDKPKRPEPDHFRVAFPSRTILDFHFHAIQLNRLNWRDFLDKRNPVAAALMSKMQIAPADRPKVKLECLRLLATLRLDPARTQLISGFVDSYLRLSAQENQEFLRGVAALPAEERKATMPLTISWKEEGRVEGRVEGARELVLKVCRKRLGTPDPQAEAKLNAIDSVERLDGLIDRLDQSETWDDLLAEPA